MGAVSPDSVRMSTLDFGHWAREEMLAGEIEIGRQMLEDRLERRPTPSRELQLVLDPDYL